MQIMFLIDEILKGSKSIDSLILGNNFILTILFGILSLALIAVALRGMIKLAREYSLSNKYIKNLKKVSKIDNITLIKTTEYTAFTAGLISPVIFVSESLKSNLTKEQFNAVIFHEISHLKDYDPLRSIIIQLVNNIIPAFPYKKTLIELYKTSIELKCDQNSENILGKKKPIIEALHSILKHNQVVLDGISISSFSFG